MRSFDASPAHKGLWLADGMASGTLNHALTMWDVAGALDPAAMESAFRSVLGEAEILRVTFADESGTLRLSPRELGDWRPFHLDLSDADDPERAAREALADLVRRPYDLSRDLLFRMGLVTLAEDRSLVVISYHHLIADGFGAGGLLSRRLAEVYTALVRGLDVPAPEHSWDAGSFAALASGYLASEQAGTDAEFWRDYLTEAPPPARVPRVVVPEARRAELAAPACDADRWAELADVIGMSARTLTVPKAEADAWADAAESMGVWMSSMLTTATAVFLRHRCDLPEFLLSMATGNRSGAAATTPGLAVNVVPIRVRAPLGGTVAELADAIVEESFAIAGHTLHHYSQIQRVSGVVSSDRGSFGTVMNIIEFADQIHFDGHPAGYSGATTGSFNELAIGVYTDGTDDSDLHIRLDAPASLYSRAELRLIGEDLIAFIRAVVADPERPIGAVDVVSGTERERVDSAGAVPGMTLAELFARQVARVPDAVAVVDGDTGVSYLELDRRSAQVATELLRRGIGPESVVTVGLPRSAELAATLLGVVKAGAAYRLVAPGGSGDSGPGIVEPVLPAGEATDHVVTVHRDNAVAVTGGVVLTQGNLARFVMDRHWTEPAVTLWHSAPDSDALALELWVPLTHGGRVVVADGDDLDRDTFAAARAVHPISLAWLPAGLFAAIAADRPDGLAGLTEVWTRTGQVPAAAVSRVRAACPGLSIVDGHGPASTSVGGGLTDGTVRYVLGPGLAPVPDGVTGELYLAGSAVARGRARQPGTTAEQYVACPFGSPGGRMLRTGDLVRRDAYGRLEYVGRTGEQIWIGGVEVDAGLLGEAIAEHPRVAQSLIHVVADDDGRRRLVAYVVPASGQAPDDLSRFVAARVPETLLPAAFTVLDRLPLTSAGLVDRARLPRPEFNDGRHRAPRDRTEEVLARLFADVLELGRIGIDDDFFDLGGNSLRAIRLVGLIRTELQLEVSIRTLFAARTIAGLSERRQNLTTSSRPALSRRTRAGAVV